MDPELKSKIEDLLSRWPDRLTEEEKQRWEESGRRLDEIFQPIFKTIEKSAMITGEDLKIFFSNKCG